LFHESTRLAPVMTSPRPAVSLSNADVSVLISSTKFHDAL